MTNMITVRTLLILAILGIVKACCPSPPTCLQAVVKATCALQPMGGSRPVNGTINLEQSGKNLRVTGTVSGLTPNQKHGFHVHANGDISTCTAAGGHYNPYGKLHGAISDSERHVGDWENIQANSAGVATFDFTDTLATLQTEFTILGRAIVVHAGEDDLGRGGAPDSKTTGNAGARLACCVIGIKL